MNRRAFLGAVAVMLVARRFIAKGEAHSGLLSMVPDSHSLDNVTGDMDTTYAEIPGYWERYWAPAVQAQSDAWLGHGTYSYRFIRTAP